MLSCETKLVVISAWNEMRSEMKANHTPSKKKMHQKAFIQVIWDSRQIHLLVSPHGSKYGKTHPTKMDSLLVLFLN